MLHLVGQLVRVVEDHGQVAERPAAAGARWVAEGESRLAQRRARAGACGDCFRADGGPGGVADLGRDGLGIAWRAGTDVRVVEAARRVAPAPHLVGERESRKQDGGGKHDAHHREGPLTAQLAERSRTCPSPPRKIP